MRHVLSMALGPVQEFLAAARRTRDLWFGSWLLSELARAAGLAIVQQGGKEALIFPASARLDEPGATFTNKILAICDGEPRQVAALATAAVRTRLDTLHSSAFAGLSDQPLFLGQVAADQVADLIEIQWASAPLGSPEGYAAARNRAEALLAARKSTRSWGPVSWGAAVPKSSIDGQRESVLHEQLFDGKNGWSANRLYRTFGVGEHERLCGVGLLKRKGKREGSRHSHHFLSTGHLAAWPVLERMRELAGREATGQRLRQAWAAFRGSIDRAQVDLEDWRVHASGQQHPILFDLDGSLLLAGRLSDLFPEIAEKRERRKRAKPIASALAELLREVGVPTPCPYYALLVADGDHMGAAIERTPEARRHQALSQALTDFADAALRVVETDHRGELVFAGGDDVLAFVPLDRAVACAGELAKAFRDTLAPFPAGEDGRSPTLSVGIGIAHFMEPLSRALDLARAAERDAKRSRDALAIHLDKRSGPALAVSGPWGELDAELDDLVTLHVEDRIPDGMAYELAELSRLAKGAPSLRGLVESEAKRFLRRKQPRHGQDAAIKPTDLARLEAVYQRIGERLGAQALAAFADRLVLARLFAEATLQARAPALGGAEEVTK